MPKPHVDNRLLYRFKSLEIPDYVPEMAVQRKIENNPYFDLVLLTGPEMTELRNQFVRSLERRGYKDSRSKLKRAFDYIMFQIAQDIDLSDMQSEGIGHVVGESRRSRGPSEDVEQEWFFVINWPTGDNIREDFGYDEADFHITVAFTGSGVDEYRKNTDTLIDREDTVPDRGLTTLFVDDDDRRGFVDQYGSREEEERPIYGDEDDDFDYTNQVNLPQH